MTKCVLDIVCRWKGVGWCICVAVCVWVSICKGCVCVSVSVCMFSLSKKSRKDYTPIRGSPLEHSRWTTLRDISLPKKWPDYPPYQKSTRATPGAKT